MLIRSPRAVAHVVVLVAFLTASGLVSRAQDAKAAAALYREASELQNAGKFGDALTKWRQFVKEYDKDASLGLAYQGLGTCSLETGAYEDAITGFEQALKRLAEGESGANLRWNLALAWQRRSAQSKDADHRRRLVEALQAVLVDKATPKDRQALASFYLAQTEHDLGKIDDANKRLRALVEGAPDKSILASSRLALATWAEEAQAWPDAIRYYEDFVKHHPDHAGAAEARLGLGDAYFRAERWKEAEKGFADIKEGKTGAGADYAYFRWAELAELRGDLKEAARRWQQYLTAAPKSPNRVRALARAGETLSQLEEHARAAETWDVLLRDFPQQKEIADLQVRLGWEWLKAGKFEQAEARLKSALAEKLPAVERSRALWGWARCATNLKKPEEAFRRYEEFLKAKEVGIGGEQAIYEAVLAAFAIRQTKSGLAWTDELAGRFPKSERAAHAQLQSARLLADQAEYEPALQRCRWVLESKVANLQAPALYLAGFCASKDRKFAEAVPFFQKVRDDYPKSEQVPAALYSLGIAHESMGANTKALAVYQELLKAYPNHPLAGQAQKRVTVLHP